MTAVLNRILILFYKKDGGKATLCLPYVCWVCGILFAVFVVFQLCLPEEERFRPTEPILQVEPVTEQHSFPSRIENPSSEVKQEKKMEVAIRKTLSYSGPQLILRPRNLASIQAGSMMEAVLVTGASNGLVKARAKERLIINGETLIETGTILIGQGSSQEDRLNIAFFQAIFPDGTMGKINAVAADLSDKIAGLKGSSWGSKSMSVAGSIGLEFVSGLSEGLQDSEGQQGVLVKKATWKNALLKASSTTAIEQSKNLMQGLKDNRPPIEISPDTSFVVIFGEAQ